MREEVENPVAKQTEIEVEQLVVNPEEIPAENEIEELVTSEIEEVGEEEDETEEPAITEMELPIKNNKKIIIGIMIILCTLLFIYIGMTIYFMNHFYFGSEINEIDVSGKSVEEIQVLQVLMASELEKYTLNLKILAFNMQIIIMSL